MGISLFEHNDAAYKAAVKMLDEKGKAAVIHPTGTGKSFIGFKLCEDNPNAVVCWLSPSEYIFKTQVENLEKAGGSINENVKFFTYSKLIFMSDEEISEIKPEYIILDEFHRCGAEIWGKSVLKLLEMYKHTAVLGLSATNIRYLDDQRDMAQELFNGNIASEMTLGEAIVRGIVAKPKYISTVFSYQKELEKYEKKFSTVRYATVRGKAEQYLEKLRRTLEKADGLDQVFFKHMPDKNGKYIVFCANAKHMDEMILNVPEWFGLVDKSPSIYRVYSESAESDREFTAFEEDNSSHLKLLFCIDMLNEGIHLNDVDGVIMFRPTVSPVVYKQQVGRAISVGTKKNPVIFDIINNFENLYSIGSIEKEMREAVEYFNYNGEGENIQVESFEIIAEVRDCIEVFENLNDLLTATWDEMYSCAEKFFKEYGHLNVPQLFKTESGLSLGHWITTQRSIYNQTTYGVLTEERIDKLNRIGMNWHTVHQQYWEESYSDAKEYFLNNGHLNVTKSENPSLVWWIVRQRAKKRANELSKEQISRLDEIGMVWDVDNKWMEKYKLAKAYFESNGNLDIPAAYVTENGIKLGIWYRSVVNLFRKGQLSKDKLVLMKAIGFKENSYAERSWNQMYGLAEEYFKTNSDLNINASYKTENGEKLGVWISSQRSAYAKGKLSQERIDALEKIGMSWQRDKSRWNTAYEYAVQYYSENESIDVPAKYICTDGFALGAWITTQRKKYFAGKLTEKQIGQLEALNICWNPNDSAWEIGFDHALSYFDANGSLNISGAYACEDGYKLSTWINNQRYKYRNGKLKKERIDRLNELDIV